MAALVEPTRTTVSEIEAGYVRERKEYDSIGIGIGESGHECDAYLWFSLRWASPAEFLSGQKLRLFDTGNIEELRLIADLRRAGFEVLDVDPSTGSQFKVRWIGGHVRGKMDGKVYGIPEAPDTWVILECKSHGEKSFKEIVPAESRGNKSKGIAPEYRPPVPIREANAKHFAQCQLYMHLGCVDRCLYLAVCKNNDQIHREIVEYDEEFAKATFQRLERIILSNRVPARIGDDPSRFPCMFCKHKAVCHGVDLGRKHCRTCVHSTPVIVDGADEPTWTCAHFGTEIDLDTQRESAECPAHLFHPDVVPGKQVDAGDGWVEYALNDGTTLLNEVSK